MPLPALVLILLAQSPGTAEGCGDPASAVSDAVAGKNCAALDAIRECLDERLASDAAPPSAEPSAGEATPQDGGALEDLEVRAGLQCDVFRSRVDSGDSPLAAVPAECQLLWRVLASRAELQQALAEERAAVARLAGVCAEVARRSADQGVAREAADARAAAEAESAAFVKAHPEVPVQAISAVLCRTEVYRKWALAQIQKTPTSDLANLEARRDLRQLATFLAGKEAAAREDLKARFQGRPLRCGNRTVKLLSSCADTPTLIDAQGARYVKDPQPACSYRSADLDRYLERDWYLGAGWFQSAAGGQQKN